MTRRNAVDAAPCGQLPQRPHRIEWVMACVISCCLSGFVWHGLLTGGGIVGGDTYPYFFPQKQLMAEAFLRGETPLWHDRTSLGYPLHAESQAGVFYPSNQLLYRCFDINTAYNASVLLHYAFACLLTWRLARSQGLSFSSSVLAAVIFVYGWFPVRLSLEWTIIGGVWFPLCVWMTVRLVDRPGLGRWICLVFCLGLHLLAGHFTLAFITQLTCLAFAAVGGQSSLGSSDAGKFQLTGIVERRTPRWRMVLLIVAAILVALLLAGVQLIPTLELRQLSQRDGANPAFDPAYGHMPPVYLTQLLASWWFWHTPEMALSREMLQHPFLMISADTNPVEAHLYLGLIPLFLLLATLNSRIRRQLRGTNWKIWGLLAGVFLIYSFGWLVPLFRHVPGFGFFMGPGRYTMVTCLGLALICGLILDVLQRRQHRAVRVVVTTAITLVTLADVLRSAQFPVCDVQIVEQAPLVGISDSWIARTLQVENEKSPVRLLAPGPNVGDLFGVSCVPQYLGLGPSEYFSADAFLETQPASADQEFPTAQQLLRLRSMAVTHILTTDPVGVLSPECALVQAGPDAFVNRVWARGLADCFLYRIRNPQERVSSELVSAIADWEMIRQRPSEVVFRVRMAASATVTLSELMFPGWIVSVDDQTAEPESQSGFGRIVDVPKGDHVVRWTYRPLSFWSGLGLSIVTATILLSSQFMHVAIQPLRRQSRQQLKLDREARLTTQPPPF